MMTNKERYKQAFSALPFPRQFTLEVEEMAQIQKKHRKKMATAAAVACAFVIGASGTVYAADIGGIQEKLSMWLYGAKTEVDVTENGSGGYVFSYEQDGETKLIGGGGVSIDEYGNETWLPADEVAEHMSESADIYVDEDGRVWIYFYDQKVEITDSFDENGMCNLTLTHEDRSIYLEITKDVDGGYSFIQTELSPESNSGENDELSKEFKTAVTYAGFSDGN